MPSGNSSKMKQYKKEFKELEEFHDNEYVMEEISLYMRVEAWDIVCAENYYDNLCEQIKRCKTFIHDLELVLQTNQLKNEEKYREYIKIVKCYQGDYKKQIPDLKKQVDNWYGN